MRLRPFAIGVTLICSLRASAYAEEEDRAELLFREGRALVQQGKTAEACPKFAASQQLDPAVGTLMNLALCYEQIGKTASAWRAYASVVTEATHSGQTARAEAAQERYRNLEFQLARIRVESNGIPEGSLFRLDGQPVERAELTRGIPVDPGFHSVTVEQNSQELWHESVQIGENDRWAVLRVLPPKAFGGPVGRPSEPVPVPETPRPMAPPTGKGQRTTGLVVASTGLGAALVGGIFAAMAHSTYQDALAECANVAQCTNPNGLSHRRQADRFDAVATGLWVGAGVALATGTFIYLSAPKSPRVGLGLAPSSSGLAVRFATCF